jgi:hypothetical protein
VGLTVTLFMAAALVAGPDRLTNPVFGFVYVWVWVGLVPVSLLLGPVWVTLNPFRTLHLLGCRLARADPDQTAVSLPNRLAVWPATAGLAAFAWLELVAPDRATIPVLLLWATLHTMTMLIGTLFAGPKWIAAADPFEVYATTLAALAPWGRDPTGRLEARSPLANLAALQPRPGMVAFVAILLGSTAFDGLSGSTWWYRQTAATPLPGILLATLTLTGCVMVVLATYTAATTLAGRLAPRPDRRRHRWAGLFVHTLVPIALGYITAHYLSLLLLEGQRVAINASDPLGRGWNLFGTAGREVDARIVNHPAVFATLQAGAVVVGHLLGAVAAHRRALTAFPGRAAVTAQLPLLVVMVGYTIAGLLLLFTE